MKREIIQTNDGSTSIYLPDWNESYHSKHGAIQEANHVFIKNGLSLFEGKPVSILEIGFGTGLNALITYYESLKNQQTIHYVGVEAYPVSIEEVVQMNYPTEINSSLNDAFQLLHTSNWETEIQFNSNFTFKKRKQFFQEIKDSNTFDLIYFDAFGYDKQPELWSVVIFKSMFDALKKNGILVTYACRSILKRNMIEAGFKVEKLPGAPGKREMLRAIKAEV
ncbi:MAG TPA: tRNA (5-methylaminomethyl-2-thiouridine)(34)-methyltransferase MnmD [Flavobacterium sp.]|uniref:tRNA (5-methylaminomethyl-2-thiouridine)(34)-methyltransferase MnmD n=1 Tax=Flavobacterium sp. TaxID=239 RepID=UPI002C7FFE22|nr:tRNA (5-methylaminomethyl-2-thiouridine)(34)-methyltransferase MnmD [Flavobacterium sp.]MCA0347814.1 tRNA (5-methylaminomethyl-2-thiouridine)(34)-methyltransferase MnmD [Bacteroidota bacterium]HPW97945.1 tRNA (5-methylaminomethyl-2-thiouridine)(34)-methyltransferase MnmD [Flavobacterium sp.]HQA74085.1 tRNA (5-methylaminomethyl-2-thiouridine)(34)-methyltransferase MnmD [Flavobacterium sp.]